MLETERLLLTNWDERDASEFLRITRNPNILPATGCPVITSLEEAQRALCDEYCAAENYKILLKNAGVNGDGSSDAERGKSEIIIGNIGLRFGEDACSESTSEPEVGFWLDEQFQGRGYASEALAEVLRHAQEDLHCPAVWGCHYEGNEKSARVLERAGFVRVRVNPRGDTRLGYTLPEVEMKREF